LSLPFEKMLRLSEQLHIIVRGEVITELMLAVTLVCAN
jgi:hypothetical protein